MSYHRSPLRTACAVAALPLLLLPHAVPAGEPARQIDFNRDVRPILSDACFQCHGPDQRNRKGGLRLDTEAGAFADLGGYRAIEPGKPGKSELVRRILAKNDRERMPPASTGHRLSAAQVDAIQRWVAQGAQWEKHWSLIPPQRPALPAVKDVRWPRNPIDHFVLARLEKEGLRPAPEADRVTLIRRATLDLTGLPPTPAEVDAFLADTRPGAYERVVERLLASPRHGERLAIKWLEAARYADTNGYQTDGERFMWRWRDWVIDAFNQNMPFDRFTLEQLAGDMLPNPTLEQRIATGFNRNHRGNSEGGIIPEEYAVEYVVDRVDTTTTVWLGLTMGCAKCHDHKYDPVTQKEFYGVYAYFNNVPERGKAIKYGNSPPLIKAPTRAQQAHLAALQAQLRKAEQRCRHLEPQRKQALRDWLATRPHVDEPWSVSDGLVAHFPLDTSPADRLHPDRPAVVKDGPPAHTQGRVGAAVPFDGKRYLDAGDVGDFGFFDRFSVAAWIRPDRADAGTILSRMADTDRADGYAVKVEGGAVHVHLVKRWLDDAIRVQTERTLTPGRWHHVLVTYDGSRVAAGVRVYVDGQSEKLKVHLDDLNQSFQTKQPFRIGAGGGPRGRFRGPIDDVRVFSRCLTPAEVAIVATPDAIADLVAAPRRTPAQTAKLSAYFLDRHAPAPVRAAHRRWCDLQRACEKLNDTIPTTMVMEEMPTPRATHVLIRGEYDKKGPKVSPGLPASLPPLPSGAPNNRLGFARWLVDPSNPLTARVTVNRYWQLYFGTGLVKTTEDFGSQGEWPSHPELLDWLATEFMAPAPPRPPLPRGERREKSAGAGRPFTRYNPAPPSPLVGEVVRGVRGAWNVKAMHRLIATSATYRQSSRVTPALLQRDPDNRLLARGPRLRL
ncbi:MAG: DUF1549 domain-containing protein, partial [Gemmataceae bacterium]|nr:DUF1549 domain-containing protein [Gemmataceae bacterium]